jgi:hypothetical protein
VEIPAIYIRVSGSCRFVNIVNIQEAGSKLKVSTGSVIA